MTARERLESRLDALRRRLRAHIYALTAASISAGTLAVTCITVWSLAREHFAAGILIAGRVALIILIVATLALLLWRPLRRLRRDHGAEILEQSLPGENGRLRTYLEARRREAQGVASPLLDLLAADADAIAGRTDSRAIVPPRRLVFMSGLALVSALGLLLLLGFGTGYWGYGSRHLLLGAELPRHAVPVRRVLIAPGDSTVRRNSDVAIRARIEGFRPDVAHVLVRFADRTEWERAPMKVAGERGDAFEFTLYAVRGPLQYYVDADGTRSSEHAIAVVDLPRIDRLRLTYTYPDWTGLPKRVQEPAGDIRAVEGTRVQVEVFADAPLQAPALIVDGEAGELVRDGNASRGTIEVSKPAHYRIAARIANELVPLTDEFTIEIVADEPPTIEIARPGRDVRATSIEEVPVRVSAQDDFRLSEVSLRYSVNGGEWRTQRLDGKVPESVSAALLRLEELGDELAETGQDRLVPGDLISYYALARDRRTTVRTDLFMVQVQPFERRYTQAQAGGSGASMGEEQGAISERQREILLATWNLQRRDRDGARARSELKDNSQMLAELQQRLAQQARTLAERTRARAPVDEDERIAAFVESLEAAALAMDPAAEHLSGFRLDQAVPAEQQALRQLLRAEAAFRDVQVSMQRDSSSEGGAQAARSFTEMFELEMDLEKNQYESESQLSMRNARQDLEETIRKLKELAERQERLAEERSAQQEQRPEQRWKQEQLRREAEDLRRRLAQMNQRQGGSRSGTSQQGTSGEPAQENDEQPQEREQVARALEAVNRALEEMRAASGAGQREPEQAEQHAREASRNLTRALGQFDRPAPSRFDEALERMADRAQNLLDEQHRVERELYDALAEGADPGQPRYGGRSGIEVRRAQELVRSKQQMADELTALQREMREAVHEHRERTPGTTRRLSEIIRDVEGSDVMYRLNRSAAEIYYGRAREAAPREGLITDTLDTLERDLREAAGRAAQEKSNRPDAPAPDALLAELGELRRALQNAREQSASARGTRGREDQRAAGEERSGEVSGNQGAGGERGLAAWDAGTATAPRADLDRLQESLARETAERSERVRVTAQRMSRGELTQAELEALRRTTNQLRRLAGDPMAGQPEALLQLVDQIELAALAAAGRDAASARAAPPAPQSARYREAVAEYYRRLGDR